MWEIDEGGMKTFDPVDNTEKMVAILRDRWRSQTATQEEDRIGKMFCLVYGRNAMGD